MKADTHSDGETVVSSRQKTFQHVARDVPGMANNHHIRFDGETYRVRNLEPEGTGVMEW
ncbi:MAG: head-tail joining protein [Gammaproteobacteria bacterium]